MVKFYTFLIAMHLILANAAVIFIMIGVTTFADIWFNLLLNGTFVIFTWFLVCVEITMRQQRAFWAFSKEAADADTMLWDWERPDARTHLFKTFCFKNPWKLYNLKKYIDV